MVTRVGIAFTPFETRADLIVRLGAWAEYRGLERVDVAEGWTHDATVVLTELALRTLRIELGSLVLSAWGGPPGRSPSPRPACSAAQVGASRSASERAARRSPRASTGSHGSAR